MSKKFLTNLDLAQNQLLNAQIQNLATAPSSPVDGQVYYNTTSNIMFYWDGTAWVEMDAGDSAVSSVAAADGTLTITPTTGAVTAKVTPGGLTHSYISDFVSTVETVRLDQMATPTNPVSMGGENITNLADPTSAQMAATKNYVDNVANGIQWKSAVQAATVAALPANTYNNGASGVGATLTGNSNGAIATIDGYQPVLGDRLLIQNEAAPANNGIYSVTTVGTGSSKYVLTRTSDFDTPTEIQGTAVLAMNGTNNINQGFTVDSAGPYTIGTTAITFTQFTGVADIIPGQGLAKSGNTLSLATLYGKYSSGANPNSTTWTVTHGLGTSAVVVQIFNTSTGAQVEADVAITNSNTVTITFAVAPTANTYTVVVIG